MANSMSARARTATNTYAVTVTIETPDPNSSTYQKDSAAILAGFELVAAGGMQPASN